MSNKRSIASYLKYALSEIFLVVIGILIAVSINNWNESKKQEKELMNIFSTIKEDLNNDIEEINDVLSFYERAEKIFEQVLNDSINRKDYLENKNIAFLIIGFPEISFDKRGFNLISNFNSGTNNLKDSLVANIVDFYTERMLEIQVDDELRAADFKENFTYLKNNYSWWTDYIHKKEISGFIDYALNSQDYKNRVATTHFITYEVFLPELILFKEQANKIINSIEKREY